MKGKIVKFILFLVCLLTCSLSNAWANYAEKVELNKFYAHQCTTYSDIYEHIPVLSNLARECSSVVEIGIREIVSTWGILHGLSESSFPQRRYIGIDLDLPPWGPLQRAREIAESQNISFQFWKGNDMEIDIPQSDLLFIDSLHTYCHLTFELEKFSPKITKYIAMHDTSAPWGMQDDNAYYGDYSEYDPSIDREKRGLWPAVVDFLERHPEWCLHERRLNNHGFTILRRVAD